MNVLVDANIFIDVNRRRQGWPGSLATIAVIESDREVEGYVSSLTMALVYFDRRRAFTEQESRLAVSRLMARFHVVALSKPIIHWALAHPCPEFEDNIQLVSALKVKADYLITRNKRHYRQEEMPVLDPEEFIALWRTSRTR